MKTPAELVFMFQARTNRLSPRASTTGVIPDSSGKRFTIASALIYRIGAHIESAWIVSTGLNPRRRVHTARPACGGMR
jgi:hypothetical protein